MANLPKYVDNFHFKNHVDPWCHKMCNPKDAEALDGVNTESCEQTFKWVNSFTAVKSMNQSHFWMFFTVIFDYHNLNKQKQLRSVVHPFSPLGWELLPQQLDIESSLLTLSTLETEEETLQPVFESVLDQFSAIDLDGDGMKLTCKECNTTYKKEWTLRNHMNKKHGHNNPGPCECDKCYEIFNNMKNLSDHIKSTHAIHICEFCEEVFFRKSDLKTHIQTHTKLFPCSECQLKFPDKAILKEHRKEHFICNICARKCESEYYLDRHRKSHKV